MSDFGCKPVRMRILRKVSQKKKYFNTTALSIRLLCLILSNKVFGHARSALEANNGQFITYDRVPVVAGGKHDIISDT